MDISRHALLKELPTQVKLFEEALRKQDFDKSLQIGESLLNQYPDSHLGYYCCAKASRSLGNIKKALSMIEKAVSSTLGGELELYVLLEANSIYRDVDMLETAAIFSYRAKHSFPGEYSGYLRFAQDLTTLGMNQLAVHVIDEGVSLFPNITAMHSVADKIRASLGKGSEEDTDNYDRDHSCNQPLPMTIAIAGNCQVAPLRLFFKQSDINVYELTPYQRITEQRMIDEWIECLLSCDAVAMIPVKYGYNKLHFGSDLIMEFCHRNGIKFITYPSFHLEMFFPFFWNARTSSGQRWTIKAIHGDYHDYLAMRLSLESSDFIDTFFRELLSLSESSPAYQVIVDIAVSSLDEFRSRYPEYWHILVADISLGLGHTYNHPRLDFLNAVYKYMWIDGLGLSPEKFVHLSQETMAAHVLPIPEFVVTALKSKVAPTFLADLLAHVPSPDLARTANNEYMKLVLRLIQYYRHQSNNVLVNYNCAKYKRADEFVRLITG